LAEYELDAIKEREVEEGRTGYDRSVNACESLELIGSL
jgi:hypothetical protein